MKKTMSEIYLSKINVSDSSLSAAPVKKPERKYETGSAERLEQEYETSLTKGLTAGEVKRRLSENRKDYLTKEKKRSWLRSAEQECLDSLFFFLIFLCVFLVLTGEEGWLTALPAPVLVSILKTRQVVRNHRFLQERKKLFLPKAQVLRDGTYQYVDVREIVIGDILRLKKGKKVPATVHSLTKPGVIYEKGEIFPEESGRAMAAGLSGSTVLKKQGILSRILSESENFPLRAQEMLFERGVTAMESASFPDAHGTKGIILDTETFPSALKPHALRELMELLRKKRIPLIFFTDQSRETAFDILKQLHLAENEKDVVDQTQFSCYLKEGALGKSYKKQMGSIRAYAGLDRRQKRKVLEAWENHCSWLYVLPDRNWNIAETWHETEKKISWLGFLDNASLDREFYFKKHWSEGLLQLLRSEAIWDIYVVWTEKVQERALAALCVFNGAMLLAGVFAKTESAFSWMFLFSTIICGGLALWKELWWLWLRRKGDW